MSGPVSVWTALKRAAATTNSYDYDVAGNRTQETIAGAQTTFVYNNSVNKLTSRSGAQGSATYTHDLNGSLTADGTRTFEWDGANRLVAINIGTHRSEFSYEGIGRRTRIVEKDNSVVTSDKRYLWCGGEICEERDSTGGVVQKRFYEQGVQDNGVNIHYTRDHLGSIREKTDTGNQVTARYDYDQWGRQTVLAGSKDTFGYAGYFVHQPSGLLLTWYRAYDPNLARWISRDPMEERNGINMYVYGANNPVRFIDPFGLQVYDCERKLGGQPGDTPPYIPIVGPTVRAPLYHEYICVKKNGKTTCRGLNPTPGRSIWRRSPGVNNPVDVYNEKGCREIPSNDCFIDCILRKFEDPLPDYAMGPHGTDCQEWADDILESCRKECNFYKSHF